MTPANKTDRIVIGAQSNDHSAQPAGVSSKRFFTDADTFARVQLLVSEYYRVDATLIKDGPVGAIVERIKLHHDKMARDGRCLIHLNQIPAETPPEHIHAAVTACHAMADFPSPGILTILNSKFRSGAALGLNVSLIDTPWPAAGKFICFSLRSPCSPW